MKWRPFLFALVPLVALLAFTEGVCALLGATVMRTRRPPMPFSTLSTNPERARMPDEHVRQVVACLGDSWTFGQGLTAEESYPGQLQSVLGDGAQVVNLGQPGANTLQAARFLHRYLNPPAGPPGRAHLVAVLAGVNPDPAETGTLSSPPALFLARFRPILWRLHTYRLLTQVVMRARLRTDPLLHNQDWQRARGGDLFDFEERARNISANLGRIDALAMEVGATVLVLTYGIPPSLARESWVPHGGVNEAIRRAARERGLPLLDLEEAYAARGVVGPEVLLYGDRRLQPENLELHPNAAGYRIFAEEVARWIRER